jgi:hypothetical protein
VVVVVVEGGRERHFDGQHSLVVVKESNTKSAARSANGTVWSVKEEVLLLIMCAPMGAKCLHTTMRRNQGLLGIERSRVAFVAAADIGWHDNKRWQV